MIAVLKLELWLTFWVALALGLAFGLPVLEMNGDGVTGLAGDAGVSKALARLAIALPLGLALFQFGLQRMRGTLAVLLHRGIEARDAFRAKFVLAMLFSSLVFTGVVLLEYRISVRQNGADPRYDAVLWVIPQLIALGGLSWTAGALVVLGGGRSFFGLGMRCLFGGLAVVGLHRWASSLGNALSPLTGYVAYLLLVAAAAAWVWAQAMRRFGDDGPPEPRGELRVAAFATLMAALLFPYFEGVRDSATRLAQRRLEPQAPQLWATPEGGTLVAEHTRNGKTYRTLEGEVVLRDQRAALPDHEAVPVQQLPVWEAVADGPGRMLKSVWSVEFPPKERSSAVRVPFQGGTELPEEPASDWQLAVATAPVAVTLQQSSGTLELLACEFDPVSGRKRFHRRVAERPDGRPLSARTRELGSAFGGGPLLLDEADGTLWSVEVERGADALVAGAGPNGNADVEWLDVAISKFWPRTGQVHPAGVAARTADGVFVRGSEGWIPFVASEEYDLAERLDPADVGPRLLVDRDPLGRHSATLLAEGGAPVHEFDLAATGSRAESSRTAWILLDVLRPPLARGVELAGHPFSRAWQAQLPWWVFGLHAAVGLLCAAFGWRRGRSPRGRALFAGLGLLAGPLGAATVHVCRGHLDGADEAGSAGERSVEPVFLDGQASIGEGAAPAPRAAA